MFYVVLNIPVCVAVTVTATLFKVRLGLALRSSANLFSTLRIDALPKKTKLTLPRNKQEIGKFSGASAF